MSSDKYGCVMSTERLLELFADAAKPRVDLASQLLFNTIDGVKASVPSPAKPMPMGERLQAAAELRALGESALRARTDCGGEAVVRRRRSRCARERRLVLFRSGPPKWRARRSARPTPDCQRGEVVALRRRALQEPPPRPTLKEMSDDALVARFEDAAIREYATRFLESVQESQDMTERNRILDEIWDIMRELKARDALGQLVPLLASPNITVRREAATRRMPARRRAEVYRNARGGCMRTGSFDDSGVWPEGRSRRLAQERQRRSRGLTMSDRVGRPRREGENFLYFSRCEITLQVRARVLHCAPRPAVSPAALLALPSSASTRTLGSSMACTSSRSASDALPAFGSVEPAM